MQNAEHFFSKEDNAQIAAAIEAAEARTAGEIAVMVVNDSDAYPEGLILGGAILGALLALVAVDRLGDDSLWLFVPSAVALALLAGLALKHLPRLHRFFIPAPQIELRVQQRAARAFYDKGLHKTRDASGVLFFLSLFERKVWVLADHGIYQQIRQEELQTYASQVVQGMKSGQPTQALCAAIGRFGTVLAHHFPIRPDDTNELPNEVIVEGTPRH